MATGWHRLIPPDDCFRGEGNYRLDAYSEFMPPPRVGWKPYGGRGPNPELFSPDDPFGWHVGEFEEALELQPGWPRSAGKCSASLPACSTATRTPGSQPSPCRTIRTGRPNWRPSRSCRTIGASRCCRWPCPAPRTTRAACAGRSSATASRGRAGRSGRASSPRRIRNCRPMRRRLLLPTAAGRLRREGRRCRRAAAGRLPHPARRRAALRRSGPKTLPSWTADFLLSERAREVPKYLLTFRPFGRLPAAVRKAYLAGQLHLLPFPGSLVFWGVPGYPPTAA